MTVPVLRKARRVDGSRLHLREAEIGDAAFILSLRLDPKRARWISPTPPSLDDQVAWLTRYKADPGQAYFIVCDAQDRAIGTVRLYDARGDSFCWGSWLLVPGLPPRAALESALLVYAYADRLGFRSARLDVRIDNADVRRFHERLFGAEQVDQNDIDCFYRVPMPDFRQPSGRFAGLVPDPLPVEFL